MERKYENTISSPMKYVRNGMISSRIQFGFVVQRVIVLLAIGWLGGATDLDELWTITVLLLGRLVRQRGRFWGTWVPPTSAKINPDLLLEINKYTVLKIKNESRNLYC